MELLTTNLTQTILLNPALLTGLGCDKLNIITGFTDCERIITHLIALQDGMVRNNKIYCNNLQINIILGMTKGMGLTLNKHEKLFKTIKQVNDNVYGIKFNLNYIYLGTDVHSKIYVWYKNNIPMIAYCGSVNYTMNAFYKRRESITQCDEKDADFYYNLLLKDTINCLNSEISNKIVFSRRTSKNEEIDDDNIENLKYEDYIYKTPIDTLSISLLTSKGKVGYGSGINWGIRPNGTKRDKDQAYIPYNIADRKDGFFPLKTNINEKNNPIFKVITKEDSFYMRIAQQGNKGIHTAESNAILGKWVRNRLGIPNGTFITKEMLLKYGATRIIFSKFENNIYLMEFENKNSNTFNYTNNESQPENIITIPYYGEIAAGHTITMDESPEYFVDIDAEDIREKSEKERYYCLKVNGDSMINAGINDGDLILLKHIKHPHEGEKIACFMDGEDATLKTYHEKNGMIELRPENPNYNSYYLSYEDFENGQAGALGIFKKVLKWHREHEE